MTSTSNWINVLPLGQWTDFYAPNGSFELRFRLESCDIINSQPEFNIITDDGILRSKHSRGGLEAIKLSDNLSVRLHMPVEFHNVPGIGLSPKMVYIFPSGSRVQEYKSGNLRRA